MLEIGTDCASVINLLSYFYEVKSISTFLSQVVQEIKFVAEYLCTSVKLTKTKVHVDDKVHCDELSFEETVNV